MTTLTPFHIAFPVDDLAAARHFYGTVLGCPEGRSSDEWIDFDLFGHQIVAHLKPRDPGAAPAHHNPVDGHDVPVPHFGVVLQPADWDAFAEKLKAAGVTFDYIDTEKAAVEAKNYTEQLGPKLPTSAMTAGK